MSGVYGRSTGAGGIGVIGEAKTGNSWGVYGKSTDGTGVYGETAAARTYTNPGVDGKSTGDGGIGVLGEANVGGAWGVAGKSASPTAVGVYGENSSGYAMFANGNAGQARDKGGWVSHAHERGVPAVRAKDEG